MPVLRTIYKDGSTGTLFLNIENLSIRLKDLKRNGAQKIWDPETGENFNLDEIIIDE